MRKAILDVFSKDVDILNRWFICMSSLGGCLALMGARVSGPKACHIMGDWRRWSVHFASCPCCESSGGNRQATTKAECQKSLGITASGASAYRKVRKRERWARDNHLDKTGHGLTMAVLGYV